MQLRLIVRGRRDVTGAVVRAGFGYRWPSWSKPEQRCTL